MTAFVKRDENNKESLGVEYNRVPFDTKYIARLLGIDKAQNWNGLGHSLQRRFLEVRCHRASSDVTVKKTRYGTVTVLGRYPEHRETIGPQRNTRAVAERQYCAELRGTMRNVAVDLRSIYRARKSARVRTCYGKRRGSGRLHCRLRLARSRHPLSADVAHIRYHHHWRTIATTNDVYSTKNS